MSRSIHIRFVPSIHKMIAITIGIQILHLVRFQHCPLNKIARGKFMIQQRTRTDIAHFCLYKSAALAWSHMINVKNPMRYRVHFDQHTFAKTRSLDRFHNDQLGMVLQRPKTFKDDASRKLYGIKCTSSLLCHYEHAYKAAYYCLRHLCPRSRFRLHR